MGKLKYYQQLFRFFVAINLVLISHLAVTAESVNLLKHHKANNRTQPVKKQPKKIRNLRQYRPRRKPKEFVYFRQPQRQGTPQGTRPAGSRNGCLVAKKIPLTALVPVTTKADGRELRWGLTTKAYPTFWFYIPYELTSIKNAKFSLRNRQNHTIYETQLQLASTPGIINVSIPQSTPSLTVGEWYQYYLFIDVNCTSKGHSRKQVAQAWVKREAIASGFQSQLERISLRQQGLLYAEKGIWYDAMKSFAQLRFAPGVNLEWLHMLESVGLGNIANQPMNELLAVEEE